MSLQQKIQSSFTAYNINSSAGATTETLDASTSSGVVRLFTNIDVTNTATLSVASGETLNGATDGTFLFSNYPVGTQFRADEVTGGWVVSAVGASVTSERYTSIDCYNEPVVAEINTLSETPFVNATLNLSASPGGIGFWQSFTLNSDNITEIEFPISNPIITARTIQPELRVYEGNGVGGTLIYTETKDAFVLAGSESDLAQVFTPNLTGLTSGIFTLEVVNIATTGTPGNFTHYVATGDVYTDGGSSLAANFDMRFRVSSTAGAEEYTVFTYEGGNAYAVKKSDNTITDVSGGVPVTWVECPVATAVNDQATSGYMDIGNMRMQWGQFITANSDVAQTITLPAAFANSTYSVVTQVTQGSGEASISDMFAVTTRTTTTFDVDRDDNIDGYTAPLMWQAIGLRP